MKILIAPTEDSIKRDRTKLTSDVLAGSNVSVPVANSAGFSANDYLVIGYEGSQQAELVQVASVSGENLVLGLLKLPHDKDEPIVQYRYNKRKFYGSLTSGGSYVELIGDSSPVTIAVNDPQGTVLEYTGGEGYLYFKSTYYNSQTSEESSILDSDEVLGDESVRYCSIYSIKKQAGLTNNPYITDGIIETYRRRAENEIDSYLASRYVIPYISQSGVQEIPPMLENLTVLLAAGYMDYQEFGKDGEGVKWLGEARAILKKLQGPGGQLLFGSDHLEMQTQSITNSVQSLPNSVDNTDDNGTQQKFSMNQNF